MGQQNYIEIDKERQQFNEHADIIRTKNKEHQKTALVTLDWAVSREKNNPGFVKKERDKHRDAGRFFNDCMDNETYLAYDERADLECMHSKVFNEWLLYREKMSDDDATELIHQIYK